MISTKTSVKRFSPSVCVCIIADDYTSVHNRDYLCARDTFWIRHTVSAKDYCAHVEANRAKYRIEKDRVIVEKSLKEEIVKHTNTIGKAFARLGEIICGVCTLFMRFNCLLIIIEQILY